MRDERECDVDPEALDDAALEVFEAMTRRCDWAGVEGMLVALEGALLGAGERARVMVAAGVRAPSGSYLASRDEIRFGSYDVEAGVRLAIGAEGGEVAGEEDE